MVSCRSFPIFVTGRSVGGTVAVSVHIETH